METYEVLNLLIQWGLLLIALISLIIYIVTNTKK